MKSNIPLRLQGIEGDAVFAYAEYPGSDDQWRDVLAEIRTKLVRFFESFYAGIVTAMESTPCACAVCRHIDELSLKLVVHSGKAVFSTIAGMQQVSGTDVILAHRWLKNSVRVSPYCSRAGSDGKKRSGSVPATRAQFDGVDLQRLKRAATAYAHATTQAGVLRAS